VCGRVCVWWVDEGLFSGTCSFFYNWGSILFPSNSCDSTANVVLIDIAETTAHIHSFHCFFEGGFHTVLRISHVLQMNNMLSTSEASVG